ncbi:MAG: protoporphyrinogen oxidase [Bryobacteraceae bacterium]|jgi:oxygen-dependent protoporphyrinogen oxidase
MPGVVIIGGGISGLSAAYYLARGDVPSTILESRPRLGGVIQTERVEGCTLEAGPDSFLSAKPAAVELLRELGLADQVIGSNDHLRVTYVRKGGRLMPLPDGLMMMVPTKILPLLTTRLLGWRTKFRMGTELLRAPRPKPGDESVAEFIEEHYGAEALDYLAEPLLSGVYGGNPSQLSVTSVLPRFVELANQYGSLTRGVLAVRAKAGRDRHATPLFRTLKGGLGQMVDAIAANIRGKVEVRQCRAQTIERAGAGFRIRADGDWLEADRMVVACEAHSATALLGGVDARLAELLGTVPYSSSMTVALGFDAADLARPPGAPPRGFGFLVPKKERRRLVACTWAGTKFSYRVPEGTVVARCFLGGMEDAGVLDESDEAIVAAATRELQEIAGVTAQPRFTRIARWPRSMAQYTVGHPQRLAEMEARAASVPGLYLAGNAYQGIGIPDCVRMGRTAAEKILAG